MVQSTASSAGGTRTRQLRDLERSDAPTVGHKAANLGALARLDLPVPPGVVIPAAETDEGLPAAVAEALSILGDVPVAVRSSALAEDLEGASPRPKSRTSVAPAALAFIAISTAQRTVPPLRSGQWATTASPCCLEGSCRVHRVARYAGVAGVVRSWPADPRRRPTQARLRSRRTSPRLDR